MLNYSSCYKIQNTVTLNKSSDSCSLNSPRIRLMTISESSEILNSFTKLRLRHRENDQYLSHVMQYQLHIIFFDHGNWKKSFHFLATCFQFTVKIEMIRGINLCSSYLANRKTCL